MIPRSSPKAGYVAHKTEIDEALNRVLRSGDYVLGSEVASFEEEFARYLGSPGGAAVGNGTDAITLGLRACGVVPGDVVATVSHTAVATVAAIEAAGAIPLLVDVDSTTYVMDPDHLQSAVATFPQRVAAVVPVHLYGHPCDMDAIMQIAARFEMSVVEDCAQAHGARRFEKMVGNFGDCGAFSFYPTKNLATFGDAGFISGPTDLVAKVKSLRQYGWKGTRFLSEERGFNSRMDELHASVLRTKLHHLEKENDTRRLLASTYSDTLFDSGVDLPQSEPSVHHVYHQYVIRVRERDSLIKYLRSRAIQVGIHYPVPIHLQPAYRGRVHMSNAALNVTETICHEILSLPIHPFMEAEAIREIANAVIEWSRTNRV